MNFLLAEKDFPLHAIGKKVYSAARPSPIFEAPSAGLAADIVSRLNRDHCASTESRDAEPSGEVGYRTE